MKINKCLIIAALVAGTIGAQAADYRFNASVDDNFLTSGNWSADWADVATTPGDGDNVLLHAGVTTVPLIIDSAIAVIPALLNPGHDSGGAAGGTLSILDGGSITAGATTVGYNTPGAVLNLSGVSSLTLQSHLSIGGGSGDGTLNMSGDSVITTPGFTHTAGSITMTGNALLSIAGNQEAGDWSFVTATGAGESIDVTFDGTDTNITVIPEPSTLALIGIASAGLFGLRRMKI